MTADPLKRSQQGTIRNVRYELSSLLATLNSQLQVWDTFAARIRPTDEKGEENLETVLPLLGTSPLESLLFSGRKDLLTRIEHLRALQSRLEVLADWNRTAIASNRDQQEAAITTFTIVTIVFLPLSWLSSVFGMNSTDIRELPYGSWLYWIIAIPFTLLVLAGAWWWAGAGKLDYLKRRRARREMCRPPDVHGFLLRRKPGAESGGMTFGQPMRSHTVASDDRFREKHELRDSSPGSNFLSRRRRANTTHTLDV